MESRIARSELRRFIGSTEDAISPKGVAPLYRRHFLTTSYPRSNPIRDQRSLEDLVRAHVGHAP